MANGNGETRKTVAQIAKELIEQKTSIEVLKNELQSMSNVNNKIDTAITKLTDVSTSIKSMLAVHEERIGKQEDVDKAIFNLLESRRIESENKFEDLHSRLNKNIKDLRDELELSEKRISCDIKEIKVNLNDRIGVLEKYRWIIIGGAIVLGLWVPEVLDLSFFLK